MQDMKKTKALLKSSADVKFYRSHIIIMSVMLACFTLLGAVCVIATRSPAFWLVPAASAMVGVPAIAWYGFNLFCIFKHTDGYRFHEVTLTHPQATWGRRLYFIVEIEGRTLETRAVFNAEGLLTPEFNDYCNHQVLIGYNADTEELVVIKERN